MDVRNIDANQAYAAALTRGAQGQPAAGAGAEQAASIAAFGSAFSNLVNGMVGQVEQSTASAEAVSAQAVAGQAGLVDVVTAMNNAEMVLETVTTVRDRVVRAYEEIMRMPI